MRVINEENDTRWCAYVMICYHEYDKKSSLPFYELICSSSLHEHNLENSDKFERFQ